MDHLGPGFWYALHMYPIYLKTQNRGDENKDMVAFYEFLHRVMPCSACKLHMVEFNIRNSLHVSNDLHGWVGKLHNEVNSRMKKQIFSHIASCKWCYDCISGSATKFEGIDSIKLWKGVGFLLASALVQMSMTRPRFAMFITYDLIHMCELTFPHTPSREHFVRARESVAEDCMSVLSKGDIDDRLNRTKDAVAELASSVRISLGESELAENKDVSLVR